MFPGLAGVRHVAHIAGLAIPAILALSGYGLDRLLQLPWPRLRLDFGLSASGSAPSMSLAWLLVIPLLASLRTADRFDQNFMVMDDRQDVYQGNRGARDPQPGVGPRSLRRTLLDRTRAGRRPQTHQRGHLVVVGVGGEPTGAARGDARRTPAGGRRLVQHE
jgi:hypothetical protein